MPRCRSLVVGLAAFGLALPAAAPAEAKRYTFGDRALREGDRGHDVRVLQDFLTRVGLETDVDGRFGPFTARRVRSWERRSEVRAVNGRVSRPNARKLRRQVEAGITVHQPEPEAVAPGEQAVLGDDGRAIAPDSAPEEVKAAIEAANRIVGKPYKYGGGHARWEDSGYDCSGAMSYALHGAGLLDEPLTSGDFMSYGERGEGQWISIYAHGGHGYLVIAGLRFDTGWNNRGGGPRWSEEMRPADGYRVRHPAGL
ncbi:MAG: peptidoglycan-binding protein [Solirubrobacteraceae bacterium]